MANSRTKRSTKADTKASAGTTAYRFDGTHADTLDGGLGIAPGQHVKLTEEDASRPAAARMLAEGQLVAVSYDTDEPSETTNDDTPAAPADTDTED